MSVAIVLPARLASTRLPHKLLLDRTGRPLLKHTIERALEAQARSAGLIQRVLVACDGERLAEVARNAGVEAVRTSPRHPSGTDRVAEAAAKLKEDIVVNVQADEPEMAPEAIVQVAALLAGGPPGAGMATLAAPIFDEAEFRKPSVVKVVVDEDGRALYFSRAPVPFRRDPGASPGTWTLPDAEGRERAVYGLHHLGIYAYRRALLLELAKMPPSRLERIERLEQLRALSHGHTILVGKTARHPPGIDTPEDYEAFVARWHAKEQEAPSGPDLDDYQADWLDRGATFYGH